MLYNEAKLFEVHSTGEAGELEKCRDRYTAAAVLYRYAAECGSPEAMNSLGLMLEDGSAKFDGISDCSEAARWFLAGAGAGSIEAAGNLALLLAAKGGGFEFSIETPSGYRASSSELEVWLDGLAQRATGNPRAQWLRDSIARLTGRITQHQYEIQTGTSPSREVKKQPERQLPRMMSNSNSTSPRRSNIGSEPVFNELPQFTKRQYNLTPGSVVGNLTHHVPQFKSSEIDVKSLAELNENVIDNQIVAPELSPKPLKYLVHPNEESEKLTKKSVGSNLDDVISAGTASSFSSDPARHLRDPSLRWDKA